MAIIPVGKEKIEEAFAAFDEHVRTSEEFLNWENSKAQRHAIEFDGKKYPPKKIISLATGMPVSALRGGPEANNYLKKRGFNIVPNTSRVVKPIPMFELGKIYQRREDIHLPYGGSWQSGISASSVSDAIFLFTGDSGDQYGYKDEFVLDESGVQVFMYTGEGQVGDMTLTRGNFAISEHSKLGRALHLFEILGKGKGVKYLGEFIYANHETKRGRDKALNEREIIVFRLISVTDAERFEAEERHDIDQIEPSTISLEEARAAAYAASSAATSPAGKSSVRNLYLRSKAVKDYVLFRANGVCESCKNPAPFLKKDGSPYLEPHHTTRVSDGGPDHPKHVAAICPACHCEIHHGEHGLAKNIDLQKFILTRED